MTLLDPLHVAVTQDFINEHPSTFSVLRKTKVPTGTGGTKTGPPATVANFTARRVGLNSVRGVVSVTSPDGKIIEVNGMIIALPDTDVAVGDLLDDGANKFEVLTIDFDPPWRLQAKVANRG